MTKSSIEHSPEPWRYHYNGNIYTKHEIIAQGLRFPNAERIVACINACAGIPTDMLDVVIAFSGISTLIYNYELQNKEQPDWLKNYKLLERKEKE
jgi:hypothetical protein